MNPEIQTPAAEQPSAAPTVPEGVDSNAAIEALKASHSEALAAKDEEIARLRAEVEELKKAPGDGTSHVVATEPNGQSNDSSQHPEVDAYCATMARAQKTYEQLPH